MAVRVAPPYGSDAPAQDVNGGKTLREDLGQLVKFRASDNRNFPPENTF